MNAPPVTSPPSGFGGLHQRRCARHASREAAARCPSCGEFFCRECVSEHAGKLLCSACLARATVTSERKRGRRAALRRIGAAAAGGLALWIAFYSVGSLLATIPADVHDGTIWKKMVTDPVP
jgi:hypothetical protein